VPLPDAPPVLVVPAAALVPAEPPSVAGSSSEQPVTHPETSVLHATKPMKAKRVFAIAPLCLS
jgi:hypothetical protein